MADLPSGTVTFLFTDIEGSTKLAQEYPTGSIVLLGAKPLKFMMKIFSGGSLRQSPQAGLL